MIITTLALLTTVSQPLLAGKIIDTPKPGKFDYMIVDNKYRRLLSAHTAAGTLCVLDLKTDKVEEIETGKVNGVVLDKKFNRIFAAGVDQKLVSLDRETLKIVGEVKFDGPADDLVIDTKREMIYVCHDDGEEDWIVDAEKLEKVGSVKIAGAPEFVLYDSTADRIFQNIKPTNQLQVIDPEKKEVVASWSTAPMTSPHGLAIDHKTQKAFAAGKNGKLAVFDIATGKLLETVKISEGTDQIAFDKDLKRIYCPGNGFLSVLEETDNGVVSLGEVEIPKSAHTLAVDPTTHDVWVSYVDEKGAHLKQFTVSK